MLNEDLQMNASYVKSCFASFAALTLLACLASSATADVIYRETFGNSDMANRKTPNIYGWQAFNSSGALVDTTSGNFGVDSGAVASNGRPMDVANVNAGPNNTSGDFAALAAARLFFNNNATGTLTVGNNARLVWTPEYTVNPATNSPGSIVMSMYLGNANATDPVRFVVRMGGGANDGWYYSTAAFTSPAVSTGANFATIAEQRSLTYDAAAANWQILTFDGTYDGAGTPDVPTTVKTAGTVPLASPSAATANLSGSITAFGILYLRADGDFTSGPQGNIRMDTFQIDATPLVVAGNANFDGINGVEGKDFLIWQQGLGTGTTLAQGDANTSGSVDGADLTIWRGQFGTPVTPVAGSVPEPATLGMFVVVAIGLAARRRRV
jgi:hypothetical protein